MTISISVVFPMFNEEGYIRTTVRCAMDVLKDITHDYEIVIVDDASTDSSGRIAEDLSRQYPAIKVAHHKKNRKLGGALKTGFALSSKDLILYSDIDMPFDLKEIRKAVDLLLKEKADLVSVYRLNRMEDDIRRCIYSYIYNMFLKIFFGLHIKDVNFSFKLIRSVFLKKLDLHAEGSFIDAEMLIKAQRRGAKIVQFGTIYFLRTKGVSRLSTPSVIFKILQEAFSFKWRSFSRKPENNK